MIKKDVPCPMTRTRALANMLGLAEALADGPAGVQIVTEWAANGGKNELKQIVAELRAWHRELSPPQPRPAAPAQSNYNFEPELDAW